MLTACGGGGGGGGGGPAPRQPDTLELVGQVTKGPVAGADVAVYALAASPGQAVTAGKTNGSGNYTLTAKVEGLDALRVRATGGTYADEVTGSSVALAPEDYLETVLPIGADAPSVHVTPLTTLAAAYAGFLMDQAGTSPADAARSANSKISQLFNVGNALTADMADPATVPNPSQQALNHALFVGAFSELAQSQGRSALALIREMAADIAADGNWGNGEGAVTPQQLTAAAEAYLARVAPGSALQVVPATAMGSDAIDLNTVESNLPPQAGEDRFFVRVDGTFQFPATLLLGNDSDPEGTALAVSAVDEASAQGGSVTFDKAAGLVTYEPAPSFTGEDSFGYRVVDGAGAAVSGRVVVHVSSSADGPFATNEDTRLVIGQSQLLALLVNGGDSAQVAAVQATDTTHGTVELSGDTVIYTPEPDFHGSATFQMTALSGRAEESVIVEVTVNPVNDLPQLANVQLATDEDVALDIPLADILAQASDADGDTLTVTAAKVGAGTHGLVELLENQVRYTPDADFNGTATFAYTVGDGNGGESTGTATVTVKPVNDAPVAGDLQVAASEGQPIDISLDTILAQASDPDGDTLTLSGVEAGADTHGTVELMESAVRYTPDANYSGPAAFQYSVTDGNGADATAAVSLQVAATNDAPVAAADFALTDFGASVLVDVAANDSDPDGDSVSVASVDAVSAGGGELTLEDGLVRYTPAARFFGADSFRYTISDGVSSADGTAEIWVVGAENNLARFASTQCSSDTPAYGQTCDKSIDGVVDGNPTDNDREWVSNGETAGATIRLAWSQPVPASAIVLYDRFNSNNQITAGTLELSDGRTFSVGALPNDGAAVTIELDGAPIESLLFTVDGVSGTTTNVGLAEIGVLSPKSVLAGGAVVNEALYTFIGPDTGGTNSEQAIDGSTATGNGWLPTGGDVLHLVFDTRKSINRVVLRESAELGSNISAGVLVFDDGTEIDVGALPNNGAAKVLTFGPRDVREITFTAQTVVGAPALLELEAFTVLPGQTEQAVEHFNDGNANGWSFTDNGTSNDPSSWGVAGGALQEASFILGQTAEGFEMGTYALWNDVTHDDLDLRLRMRSSDIGVMGVMFGYQDDNNYYRFSLSQREGYRKLERRVGGTFTELGTSPQSYETDAWYNVRILMQNGVIVAFLNGQQIMSVADGSFTSGKVAVWTSRTEFATDWDKIIVLDGPTLPVVGLVQPGEYFVTAGGTFTASAVATQSVGGVEFVIDENTASEQTARILAEPYQAEFTFGSPGEHTVHAYGIDNNGDRMAHADASDAMTAVGVNGIHLVGFGDSITDGVGDDFAEDDVSLDGRNTSGGWEPVLNDELSARNPDVPVTVIDEGNPGDKTTQGVTKVGSVVARTPAAQAYLIMFGSNDSSGSLPVTDTQFKANLKTITDAILAEGKLAFIAKPPLKIGKASQNAVIESYNAKIDELIAEYAASNPDKVFAGPDFYDYFTNNPSEISADNVHPTGQGYASMGVLWADAVEGQF